MQNTNTRNALVALAIIVLACLGWYFFTHTSTPNLADTNATSTTEAASQNATTTSVGSGVTVFGSAATPKAPSLDRSIPASSLGLSAEARTQTTLNIQATVTKLKANPLSYSDWLYLGLYRQVLTDYVGAKEALEYAAAIAPNEITAFENLGALYAVNIKDYAKAEANFKKAIAINSRYVDSYQQLFDLYRYHYKQSTSAAVDILKQGITSNPNELSLYITLARYYRDSGQSASARVQYDAAIALAKTQGNASVAADLQAEKNAIQ